MRAVGYGQVGEPDVLELFNQPVPEDLGPDDVRVRLVRSGVNPTDWKSRRGALSMPIPPGGRQVPHHDGAGVVDRVGAAVDPALVGQRVWVWQAAYRRLGGTAAEYVVLPRAQVEILPPGASFDTGASLGIPYMTAHRALTIAEGAPRELAPGRLTNWTVLVAGGAGAVGHATIQLAHWAGATVITTVSSPEKAQLARAAGADHVVDYRTEDAAAVIRRIAPDGVDVIVEVSPAANAKLDAAVLKFGGAIAIYANDGGNDLAIPVRETMTINARYQFVLIYTVPDEAKRASCRSIAQALADGALGVGEDRGMPLHHFALDATRAAHEALEKRPVGRVLVDIDGTARAGGLGA